MALHDSDSLVIEANGAAESIPDAATFPGRTYELKNNSNVTQVWSVAAGLGFTVGGVNSATLTLPVGGSTRIYSNGTRWVSAGGPARKFIAATGVSDGAGNVVFNIAAAGFLVAPVVTAVLQTTTTNLTEARVTAVSATSVTVNARQTAGINVALLGLTLLGVPTALPGTTIHMIATEAGATP